MAKPTRIRSHHKPTKIYLSEWMEFRGLSDAQMAGRLDISRETVWKWQREQKRLDPDKMAALAHALDIEPEELWRPPQRRSLDALVKDAPDDIRDVAYDVVSRLLKRG